MAAELDRRSFLALGAGAVALAACGGGGGGTAKPSGSSGSSTAPSDGSTGSTSSDAAWTLAAFTDFSALVPATPQRITFGLANKEGVLVREPPVSQLTIAVSKDDGTPVGTPVTVDKHEQGLERPYFPLVFTPPSAGIYTLDTKVDGVAVQSQIQIPETTKATQPGQPMIPLDTPTTSDLRGVELLCTRSPACPLHDITLREALAKGTPVAFLVATPQFCQTAICGPVLDVLLAVAPEFPQVKFLHSEVYPSVADAQPNSQKTVEAINTYNLFFEPWLLLARPDGTIERRLDVIFDQAELRDALAGLTA